MDLYRTMDDISAANGRINMLYAEWAKRHGMSYGLLMVLFALKHQGPRTQKDIVNEWLIPKQTVHTIIKDLEERGLVTLSEGRNRKEKLITLTVEGEIHAGNELREIDGIEIRCLEKMGEEKTALMLSLIREFSEIFGEAVYAR